MSKVVEFAPEAEVSIINDIEPTGQVIGGLVFFQFIQGHGGFTRAGAYIVQLITPKH